MRHLNLSLTAESLGLAGAPAPFPLDGENGPTPCGPCKGTGQRLLLGNIVTDTDCPMCLGEGTRA